MIKYFKNELKHVPFLAITLSLLYGIVLIFNSYTNVNATGVTCAVDSNFSHSSGYNSMNTRLTGVENTIGTATLTTTAQNLTGAINELKTGFLTTQQLSNLITWNSTYVDTEKTSGYVFLYGKVIYIRFEITLLDNYTTLTTLGTLASGNRPPGNVYLVVNNLTANGPDTRLMRLTSGGSIQIYGGNKATSSDTTHYVGHFTYLKAN